MGPDKLLVISDYDRKKEYEHKLGPEWKVMKVGEPLMGYGPFKLIMLCIDRARHKAHGSNTEMNRISEWINRLVGLKLAKDGHVIEPY